eukprot:6179082-Pleurochrysis_carterae.AAC.1
MLRRPSPHLHGRLRLVQLAPRLRGFSLAALRARCGARRRDCAHVRLIAESEKGGMFEEDWAVPGSVGRNRVCVQSQSLFRTLTPSASVFASVSARESASVFGPASKKTSASVFANSSANARGLHACNT